MILAARFTLRGLICTRKQYLKESGRSSKMTSSCNGLLRLSRRESSALPEKQ